MNKNIDKLPEVCYGVLNTSNELIIIKRGESGYYRTDYPAAKTRKDAEEWCDELNERMDITKAQKKLWNVVLCSDGMYQEPILIVTLIKIFNLKEERKYDEK